MAENKYLFYSDFLKNQNINNKNILVAKTKSSYLIGPKINHKFDGVSFYKRIKSNCIYSPKIYKKMFKRKCVFLINKYAGKSQHMLGGFSKTGHKGKPVWTRRTTL